MGTVTAAGADMAGAAKAGAAMVGVEMVGVAADGVAGMATAVGTDIAVDMRAAGTLADRGLPRLTAGVTSYAERVPAAYTVADPVLSAALGDLE